MRQFANRMERFDPGRQCCASDMSDWYEGSFFDHSGAAEDAVSEGEGIGVGGGGNY